MALFNVIVRHPVSINLYVNLMHLSNDFDLGDCHLHQENGLFVLSIKWRMVNQTALFSVSELGRPCSFWEKVSGDGPTWIHRHSQARRVLR